MQDQQDESGWDDLLSELGAEPAADAFERKQPANALPEPEAASPVPQSEPEPVQPSDSDWAELAGQLGIETPIEAEGESVLGSPERIDDDFDFGEGEAASVQEALPPAAEPADEVGGSEQSIEEPEPEPFIGFADPDDGLDDAEEIAEESVEEVSAADSEVSMADTETALDTAFGEVEESADESADADDVEDQPRGVAGEAARSAFDALFSRIPSRFRPASSEPEDASEGPDVNDTGSAFGEGIDATESEASSEEVAAEGDSDESDEPGDKPKRRRRRRRGRRGRGGRSGDSPAAENADLADSDDGLGSRSGAEDADDGFGAGLGPAEKEESGDDEDGEERRPRRRRSRRRRRKPAESGAETGSVSDSADEDDDLANVGFGQGLEGDDAEAEEGAPRRSSHRSIPSWSEAINVIVDANLEGRSRAPSRASSSRGRGGRGGRGGRRRGGGGGGGRGDGGPKN
ncbi:MAG: hypothetical protein AAGA92_03620 [Planctomycetota bacterium]